MRHCIRRRANSHQHAATQVSCFVKVFFHSIICSVKITSTSHDGCWARFTLLNDTALSLRCHTSFQQDLTAASFEAFIASSESSVRPISCFVFSRAAVFGYFTIIEIWPRNGHRGIRNGNRSKGEQHPRQIRDGSISRTERNSDVGAHNAVHRELPEQIEFSWSSIFPGENCFSHSWENWQTPSVACFSRIMRFTVINSEVYPPTLLYPLKIWYFSFPINIWPSPVCKRLVFGTPILSQEKLKKCATARC
jgi:hypothetical protein